MALQPRPDYTLGEMVRVEGKRVETVLWLCDLEGLEDHPPVVLKRRLEERGFLVDEEEIERVLKGRPRLPEDLEARVARVYGEEVAEALSRFLGAKR